jgi:hypothetical protein
MGSASVCKILRDQILQVVQGGWVSLLLPSPEIAQGFVLGVAGGTLIQVLSKLGHFECGIFPGYFQLNILGNRIKAFRA